MTTHQNSRSILSALRSKTIITIFRWIPGPKTQGWYKVIMWQGLSTSKMPRNVAMTIFTIKKGMLLSGSTNWGEKRAMKSTRVR